MHPIGSFHNSFRRLLGPLAIAALVAAPVRAELLHKYTFNNNSAQDSVGGAHGTVIDRTGISSYTGGALNLTNNNGAASGQDFTQATTVGAFVDLPNGIFSNAIAVGDFGKATIETWVTVQENRTWARVWDIGTSGPGEGLSGDSPNAEYVFFAPQIGGPQNGASASTHNSTGDAFATAPQPLSLNTRHHVVVTFDHFDTTAGANGTVRLYIDNQPAVAAEIRPFLDTLPDNNVWLGRAQWNDPLFDGFIDEFRIYSHALDADDVAMNFENGPEPAPLPVLVVDRSTGAISLENQSEGNIQIKGYSISSASGSLNPAGWQSIDTANGFDPDGTWTTSSLTNLQIAEANTGGTSLNGGTLVPDASRQIGNPWFKTPFEDLTFSFTLGDNSTGTGLVQYIGAEPIRSDFNGDGAVTAADWTIFKNNSYTDLSAQPDAQAYLRGDLDLDGDNDFIDFRLFKNDFVAANGEAAFAALVGAVPEPATFTMGAAAAALLLAQSRRRAKQ